MYQLPSRLGRPSKKLGTRSKLFQTKGEAIKIISDKPINQDPIPQPEPTPEPNPDPINSVPVGGDVKP
jgi:hypothetical protein